MKPVLCINAGSSSVKAAYFDTDGGREDFRYDKLEDPRAGFDSLLHDLGSRHPAVVGHRFVHGGEITEAARMVDAAERERLEGIIPLAPLHLPGNLMGLDVCAERFGVPQVACFDTAFHVTLPERARRLPIPQEYGLRRFGFHGLSYAHVASRLPTLLGPVARGRVVVAHLGSGASLTMLHELKSVDTTMGYTPAGGIPMGTRSGDLDPGVMLELGKRLNPEDLSDLVYHHMGLLALSDGEGHEMKALLASPSNQARFAVDYFCAHARSAIGGMAARAGGIDALVFTGGIGEHAAEIRSAICGPLAFLGFRLDAEANAHSFSAIEAERSKPVRVVPANEEATIRDQCLTLLEQSVAGV